MKKAILLSVLFGLFFLTSCDEDENNSSTGTMKLAINGLEDLGTDFVYEGWIIVNGSPITTGVFTVDASGNLSQTAFDVEMSDLQNATAFVLTIEPAVGDDPAPSDVHILGGDLNQGAGTLSVGHATAIGSDFANAAGKYILATPTDDLADNENSGVWFLDPSAGPGAGLSLPALPSGWKYEGWGVIGGQAVTTGTFSSVTGADDAAPYSGGQPGPPFPGEDFLTNAPNGLSFPTDLAGSTIVISIEPVPDNSPAPFLLKPLVGSVPAGAMDHTTYDMGQNLGSLPTGSVSAK